MTVPFLDTRRPRVFAHRGLAVEAPENTLLAFAKAIAAGATHIETDVHASRDGWAILSHDPDLKRLTGRDQRIGELTVAELAKIDLGDGQTFSTLEDALDAFPETRFNIDVKDAAAVEPAAQAVRTARAERRVLITSFSAARRRATVALLPGVASSADARQVLGAVLAAALHLDAVVRRLLRGVVALQVPERYGILRVVRPRLIAAAHAAGVEVHVWTVNDPDDMRRLLALGVDGIVTDRADLAVTLS